MRHGQPPPHQPPPAELNALLAAFNAGRHDALERLAQRMTEAYPGFAFGWKALGVALKQGAKSAAALRPMQRAVQLDPGDYETHCNLGIILKSLRRRDEAVASFMRALARNPRHILSLISLGRLYADEGGMDEARRTLQTAMELEPENPAVLSLFVSLRKMTAADTVWLDTATRVVDRTTTSAHDRALLLHAIGKFHDDTRNYAAAFSCHRQANEMRQAQGRPYNPAQTTALTDRIIAAHPAPAAPGAMPGTHDSLRPLFIVGMPRSGTSLLEQVLASHPAVHGAGELQFWANVVHAYPQALTSSSHPPEWREYVAAECLSNLDCHDRAAARVVDKMPGNFQRLGLIHAVFPNARILHMRRNPVDTCLSIYFQDFHGGHAYACDLDHLAHYYRAYRRLTDHWRAILPPAVFLDVDYDALVDDLEGWGRKIVDFIGLEWDPRCLEFHATERRVGTASNWQARQPLYRTAKERWRNYADFIGPLLPLLDDTQRGA